ncbi:GDCCVxC domain-containing (seleno)protein [uncultured Draconibacterium sp.]|uniref:GDCCVxC domain-containing (seleno)protein n=1 Tax=uncultured Draconibacterium sp. TaxID=1573823 RepID=UPI00321726F1
MGIITKSIITCPKCGFQKEETMPEDSCQFLYKCEKCKTVLKDCCVYCTYGSVNCPSKQQSKKCY